MLEEAAQDDRVAGILIRTGNTPSGWATLQSVRNAVLRFKKSGKPVWAYGEDISQRDYFVASAADSIFLNPVGDFDLRGLAAQLQFFKGTLDKLGVEPEIFYAGRFKSATEPFREYKMTDANRLQQSVMIKGLWAEYLSAAARHAGVDTAVVSDWTQTGAVLFPEDALARRLVDKIAYWDEVESILKAKTDVDSGDKLKLTTFKEYGAARVKSSSGGDRIAVLFAEGDIVDGKGAGGYQIAEEPFVKEIRRIRDNEDVKAVVLRINSPGGSARASEMILRELKLLQEKKKLIVSMGDVAASGGYYIASSADSIFVQPTTLTGSIGVFSMMFNANGLLTEKLGVTFDEVKNAPFAGGPSLVTPISPDERVRIQRGVDTIYALFKRRVSTGRRLTGEAVDSLAQGRVWLGKDAITNGLADATGGLDRALESAAKSAGLKDYSVVTYPEPVDRFQMLLKRFDNMTQSQVQEMLEKNVPAAAGAYEQLSRPAAHEWTCPDAVAFQLESTVNLPGIGSSCCNLQQQ